MNEGTGCIKGYMGLMVVCALGTILRKVFPQCFLKSPIHGNVV